MEQLNTVRSRESTQGADSSADLFATPPLARALDRDHRSRQVLTRWPRAITALRHAHAPSRPRGSRCVAIRVRAADVIGHANSAEVQLVINSSAHMPTPESPGRWSEHGPRAGQRRGSTPGGLAVPDFHLQREPFLNLHHSPAFVAADVESRRTARSSVCGCGDCQLPLGQPVVMAVDGGM